MKNKILFVVLALAMLCFAGCAKKDASVLTVGATPEPHAEMLKLVVDNLAEDGITLKVIEFTDYVTPNEALASSNALQPSTGCPATQISR